MIDDEGLGASILLEDGFGGGLLEIAGLGGSGALMGFLPTGCIELYTQFWAKAFSVEVAV